jgi:predicted MFS family arabinose efflux permease
MNFLGFPIGAAIGGALADQSLGLAILPGIVASVGAVAFAVTMVPRADPNPGLGAQANLATD